LIGVCCPAALLGSSATLTLLTALSSARGRSVALPGSGIIPCAKIVAIVGISQSSIHQCPYACHNAMGVSSQTTAAESATA